jgi:hypothetical protein
MRGHSVAVSQRRRRGSGAVLSSSSTEVDCASVGLARLHRARGCPGRLVSSELAGVDVTSGSLA